VAEWRLLTIDFRRTYQLELEDSLNRSFRWFAIYVAGLLSFPDTLLHARFRADEEPAPEGDML